MSRQHLVLLSIVFACGVAGMMHLANGEQQKTICVLQPIDQSIKPHIVNMTLDVLAAHHEETRLVGLVQELTDKSNTGCDYVVQFQRAVNSNYYWVDKNAHYTVSGDTITIYTNTTPVDIPSSIAFGGPAAGGKGGDVIMPAMTNPVCLAEAIATYHQNLGFSGSETCDPYAGYSEMKNDNVPLPTVYKSIEQALEQLHL